MGQAQLVISLVFIGLFTVAVLGFAVNFAVDNNSDISISDSPEFSNLYTQTGSNLSGFRGDAQGTYQSIVETNIQEGSEVAQNVGAFAITPSNVLGIVTNILRVAYVSVFGGDSGFGIFLTTLSAALLFLMGLFLYKTLRGVPD